MKKYIYSFILLPVFILSNLSAYTQIGYQFTEIKRLPVTNVKDQNRSGTCWSFSGLAFLEAKMFRAGKKGVPELSRMSVVKNCYVDKAVNM